MTNSLFDDLRNLKKALDKSSIVAITDINGVIQSVNERFVEISGFSKSELVGNTHRIINSGYHPNEFFKKFWETILSGKVWNGEIRNRKKNGEIYWVYATVTPVLDIQGKPIQFISIRTDITEQKRLQSELKESNEQLEKRVHERTKELHTAITELARSNRELEDFASIASHDLQEPLRKIQSFGAILQEEYEKKLKGEGGLYIEKMVIAAERMRNLIENLLMYSRVTTKAQPYISVNLNKLATDVVTDLEFRIEDLHAEVKIDKLPIITADPYQMQQLFQNLIANGLKFQKLGVIPKIKISSKNINGKAKIYFADNGIGFDEKYIDRIFNIFERLHGKNEYEGTGIGLAVCRKIVLRHGGEINVKSKPGKGSIFIITLPISHEKGGELHV